MSKVDAQRAMREAKYVREHAEADARRARAAAAATAAPPATATPAPGGAATAAPAAAATRAPAARPASPRPAAPAEAVTTPAVLVERCGHRSMNGRECTREAAHPEKSHRYG